MDTTLVFVGGPSPSPADRDALLDRLSALVVDRIVAADSGLQLAGALGLPLVAGRDVVLGDMDSVPAGLLERAEQDGIRVERFPADKDATDLELALDDAATHADPGDRLVLVGTTDGRFDHVLAALSVLASDAYDAFAREAWLGKDVVHVVRAAQDLSVPAGATFSVLPVHGGASGVTATGVRWELHAETLDAGTSRGVSNEAVGEVVTVGCAAGTLLVVVPGEVAR